MKLFEQKRYGSDTSSYGDDLRVLAINESHTDLGKLNSCMKLIFESGQLGYFSSSQSGFWTNSKEVFETIENCSGLTAIYMFCANHSNWSLDLRDQTDLTKFITQQESCALTLKFPSTMTQISFSSLKVNCDLSNLTNDLSLNLSWSQKAATRYILKTIPSTITLTTLLMRPNYCLYKDTDLSIFKEIYDAKGYKLKIDKLRDDGGDSASTSLTSLAGIEYIEGLKELYLEKSNTPNLKNISSLGVHANTLIGLRLDNCSISDATVISKLTHLTYLDLSNNCLAVYVEVDKKDSNGNIVLDADNNPIKEKWYTVKEICDRMRSNVPTYTTIDGESVIDVEKATVKLKGNSSILDWSDYTSDTSKFSSSSTYGST